MRISSSLDAAFASSARACSGQRFIFMNFDDARLALLRKHGLLYGVVLIDVHGTTFISHIEADL